MSALVLTSKPEDGGYCDGIEDDLQAPVGAQGNTTLVCQPPENNLGSFAPLVSINGFYARPSAQDAELYLHIFRRFSEEVSITAPVLQ